MGKKILLADDSITIQKVIELTFSDEDFEVITVGNGRLAIERATEARPDVVLCDIIMPEKDGYEVCEFIKRSPELSHVPVLLLTGAFEPFDQERAAKVGADGFLAKPFEPQSLIAKVKDLLAQAPRPAPSAAPPAAPSRPTPPPTPPRTPQPPAARPAAAPPTPPPVRPAPPPPAPQAMRPAPPGRPAPPPPPAPQPPVEFPATATPATDAADMGFLVDEGEPGMPGEPTWEMDLPPAQPALPDALGAEAALEFTAEAAAETAAFIPEEPIGEEASPGGVEEEPAQSEEEFFAQPLDADTDELAHLGEAEVGTTAPMGFPEEPADAVGYAPLDLPTPDATREVPLEERARASVEAARVDEPVFDEMLEGTVAAEETVPIPPVEVELPAALPESEGWAPVPPAAAEAPVAESFAEVALPADEGAVGKPGPSQASGVAIPVDQVEQIARRVVGQISEKVIREIAWEVIPDLAEALIRQEIERLKKETEGA